MTAHAVRESQAGNARTGAGGGWRNAGSAPPHSRRMNRKTMRVTTTEDRYLLEKLT
jgi:hypothetical protein